MVPVWRRSRTFPGPGTTASSTVPARADEVNQVQDDVDDQDSEAGQEQVEQQLTRARSSGQGDVQQKRGGIGCHANTVVPVRTDAAKAHVGSLRLAGRLPSSGV
jgi:hypothetical protein